MKSIVINYLIIGFFLIAGCSSKDKSSSEEVKTLNVKEIKLNSEDDTETNKEEDVVDVSIESIPFIAEPAKKKRTKSSK